MDTYTIPGYTLPAAAGESTSGITQTTDVERNDDDECTFLDYFDN